MMKEKRSEGVWGIEKIMTVIVEHFNNEKREGVESMESSSWCYRRIVGVGISSG